MLRRPRSAKIHYQVHHGTSVNTHLASDGPSILTLSDLELGSSDSNRHSNVQRITSINVRCRLSFSQFPGVIPGELNYLYVWIVQDASPKLTTVVWSDIFAGVAGRPSTYYPRFDHAKRFKVLSSTKISLRYPILNGNRPDDAYDQGKPFVVTCKPSSNTVWDDNSRYVSGQIIMVVQLEKAWTDKTCIHSLDWVPNTRFHSI